MRKPFRMRKNKIWQMLWMAELDAICNTKYYTRRKVYYVRNWWDKQNSQDGLDWVKEREGRMHLLFRIQPESLGAIEILSLRTACLCAMTGQGKKLLLLKGQLQVKLKYTNGVTWHLGWCNGHTRNHGGFKSQRQTLEEVSQRLTPCDRPKWRWILKVTCTYDFPCCVSVIAYGRCLSGAINHQEPCGLTMATSST
jgi:hypothetical protein